MPLFKKQGLASSSSCSIRTSECTGQEKRSSEVRTHLRLQGVSTQRVAKSRLTNASAASILGPNT